MTEEQQAANSDASDLNILATVDSGDTADILAELDELAGSKTSAEIAKPKPAAQKPEASSISNAATSSAPAPAATASSTTSAWSWNTFAEGLTSSLTGAAADVEAVIDGENTDLGATKADIQEMESAIASAEQAVSSVMFSAFSTVSETLVGPSTTAAKKKKTKKKGGVPVDDSDLDALTHGPSGGNAAEPTKASADQPTDATRSEQQSSTAATTPASSGWISWTDSLENETSELLSSTLPNFPAPPALDADGNEVCQTGQQEAAPDTAAEAAESVSSSLWSAFSSVSDTLMKTASNEAANVKSTSAGTSNMFMQLYTSKVNQAAAWIEDLEDAENSKDPYKHLKQHLKDYLKDYPTGTYEGWIQKWTQEQDWGEDEEQTATGGPTANEGETSEESSNIRIDPSYYKEESIHRNFWNENNYADGIPVDDENVPRKYVQARGTSAAVKRV